MVLILTLTMYGHFFVLSCVLCTPYLATIILGEFNAQSGLFRIRYVPTYFDKSALIQIGLVKGKPGFVVLVVQQTCTHI